MERINKQPTGMIYTGSISSRPIVCPIVLGHAGAVGSFTASQLQDLLDLIVCTEFYTFIYMQTGYI